MKQFQGLKVRSIKSLRPAEGMGFGSAAHIKYISEGEDKYLLSEICGVMERLMLSSDGVCQV